MANDPGGKPDVRDSMSNWGLAKGPYPISMKSLLPKKDEVENIVVPVCLSSSHFAFGSIRMEPVFRHPLRKNCSVFKKYPD